MQNLNAEEQRAAEEDAESRWTLPVSLRKLRELCVQTF
jgi:hypothetical protein